VKTSLNRKIAVLTVTTMAAFAVWPESARADVYWNGGISSDWSNRANWSGGLPSTGGAGNAFINPGSPNISPQVSTPGNTTVGQTYLSIGAGLSVVNGGELTTSDLITGIWGNSLPVSIGGGSLTVYGTLNMGAGGYAGEVDISGGTNSAIYVTDNSTLTVSGGSLSAISQLDVAGYNTNTAILNVSAGSVNVGALTLNAAGKNTGASYVNLTGGTITQLGPLSINTTHPAVLNLAGGTLILPDLFNNLNNVNYWINNSHSIVAYNGAGTVNVDTTTSPGNLILTGTAGAPIRTRYWNGNVSQSWANPNNFQSDGSNLPGVPETGNTLYLLSWGVREPLINSSGNATLNDIHVNKNMTIASGGELDTMTFKLAESSSATLTVSGGLLTATNSLDVGGHNGATAIMNVTNGTVSVGSLFLNANGDTNITVGGSQVYLTGGTLAASALTIVETHPTVLNIAGGRLVLPNSQLDNARFWMNDGAISAYGLADSTNSFNINQTMIPGSAVITAIYPGFGMPAFPQWNPEVFTNLTSSLDQAMSLVPTGLTGPTNADYSFGSAVATNGDVYFTEFGNQRIQKYTLASGTMTTVVTNRPGLFGLAVDNASNLFYAQDFGVGASKVVWRKTNGTEQDIITNMTAPKQVAVDAAGNVYAVQEWGAIYKWTKNTGVSTVLMQTPPVLQGAVVAPDGKIYFCTYARGGGTGTILTQGAVWVRQTNGVTRPLAGGFGRGRGIALAPNGDLYVAAEANVWDNGNSGLLVKIATNGVMTRVVSGIDYPQFPSVAPDGKVYCTLARDNKLVCYDPQNSFALQPAPKPGVTLTAQGATWQQTAAGNYPFQLHLTNTNNPADTMAIPGYLRVNPGAGNASLWFNVPVTNFHISLVQLTNSAGNTNSGAFQLPAASVDWAYGVANASVMPLREHKRCRWPMTNPGNGALEAPAPDFGEKPVSYLVYVSIVTPPALKIQPWTGNQVRISWPALAAGYLLQRSTTANAGYTSSGLTVTVEGSESAAYDTRAASARFYRLIK
jgi:hypothetical protein